MQKSVVAVCMLYNGLTLLQVTFGDMDCRILRLITFFAKEMRAMVWKRDAIIGRLQLAEQQLQSSLAKYGF
ncbi:unnamed protein product [Calypogeia fissa]